MGAHAATRDGRENRGAGRSTESKSIIASADNRANSPSGPELLAAQHLDSSVVTSVRHDQVMNLDSNVLNLSEMLP